MKKTRAALGAPRSFSTALDTDNRVIIHTEPGRSKVWLLLLLVYDSAHYGFFNALVEFV
jgi:hypothetical protein